MRARLAICGLILIASVSAVALGSNCPAPDPNAGMTGTEVPLSISTNVYYCCDRDIGEDPCENTIFGTWYDYCWWARWRYVQVFYGGRKYYIYRCASAASGECCNGATSPPSGCTPGAYNTFVNDEECYEEPVPVPVP